MNKVVLIGYMAVGKTTIGQLLAQKMNWKWLDLDKVVEKKVNLSVNEIFKLKGEIYFRKLEHEVFKEIIQNNEKVFAYKIQGVRYDIGQQLIFFSVPSV